MEQKNELDQCLKRVRLRDEISLLLSITKAEEEAAQDQDEDATRSVRKLPSLPVWPDLAIFLHFGQPFKSGGNNYFTQINSSEFIVGQLL